MSKKYKLLNVNSNKKTFGDEGQMLNYIKKKDLKPNDMTDTIEYEVITTKKKAIKVTIDKLSSEYGIKLLEAMKRRLISGDELQGNPDMYKGYKLEKIKEHPVLKELYEILLTNNYPEDGFPKNTWYTWKPFINSAMMEFIDYLIENYDKHDLTMIKQMTDYRPSNGYGIKFEGVGYLFLREGGVLFSDWAVYGRNVYSRGRHPLTDKDVIKLIGE